MGLQLTLAFVAVALAGVVMAVLISAFTINRDIRRIAEGQESDFTSSAAVAVRVAYRQSGWRNTNLAPVVAFVTRTGTGLEVRNDRGAMVDASPGFADLSHMGDLITSPVVVHGHRVGWVTIAFARDALDQVSNPYSAERWQTRTEAAAIAVVIAVLVALLLSRSIAGPIDRLIWAARSRTGGDVGARVGDVRGLGKLRELSMAFDEMAAAREEQDQVRRNLVADVAHEIRTPIAVLQAGHEAMLDGLTEPTPEQLVSLRDEVLRLARMVDDLQRLVSAEAAALQLTLVKRDLAAIAATAAGSLVDAFEAANVRLVERLDKVEVMSDPLRMHEVVVNLLTNAVKFTPAGGEVTLETRRVDGQGELKVTDTGIGIPADELPHVAERFFRGQRSSEVAGSGIGLTIVAELIRAHHGTLGFASQQGKGTSVTVMLPIADGSAAPGQRPAPPARTARPARPVPPRGGSESASRRHRTGIIARDNLDLPRRDQTAYPDEEDTNPPRLSCVIVQSVGRVRNPGWPNGRYYR
jgi:two-component system, OmpR family, sensor histidine kinase BaeS